MYDDNFIGQDTAKALGSAIINNKTLKKLLLYDQYGITTQPVDKESAMIIIRSLYNNNIITELYGLNITLCEDDITMVTGEVERINSIRQSYNEHVIDITLRFTDPQGRRYATYTTEDKLSW